MSKSKYPLLKSLPSFVCLSLILATFNNCGGGFTALSKDSSSNASSVVVPSRFSRVTQILNANCVSCHRSGGSAGQARLDFETEAQFISAGMITPGDPAASKLIFRLKNYPDTQVTNRNMPTVGQLSNDDYGVLYGWVAQMSDTVGPFSCDANQLIEDKLVSSNLKRHSRRQYINTLYDLISVALPRNTAVQIVDQAIGQTTLLQDGGEHARFDSSIVNQTIRSYFDISNSLANSLTTDPNFSTFINGYVALNRGTCTTVNISNISVACVDQFITNFSLYALRRPIRTNQTPSELQLFRDTYTLAGGGRAGMNAAVFKMLLSPHFLFQIEDAENVIANTSESIYRLSSFAIVSRLTYMFWNSMPDTYLLNQAQTLDLSADGNFLTVLDYVANHVKSGDSMKEFVREWLHLDSIPEFATNNPGLTYLANGLTLDSSLRDAMIHEIEDLGEYAYRTNKPFSTLFSSNISFARDSRLMNIYGLNTPSPVTVDDQNAVRFPSSDPRSGILTRAALLIGGTEIENPVKRGIRVRREVMCLSLENPPGELIGALTPPPPNPNITTRERYSQSTSAPICMSCHQYINSFGFALGSFNAIGRFQVREPVFDLNGGFSGNTLPVNTQVDLSTSLAPGLSAANSNELSSLVGSQSSTQRCFTEKFYRFSISRAEDRTKESCRLNSMYSQLQRSRSLKDFIKTMSLNDEFRLRRLQR